MKATDAFKRTIQKYLEERAASDPLFAETFKKEGKNINDCITYILNTVKSSACNGFEDEEVFGMAVHYYDEDNIKVGSKVTGQVVVNHRVDVKLSSKEIKEAKEKALQDLYQQQREKMMKKPRRKPETPSQTVTAQTLF